MGACISKFGKDGSLENAQHHVNSHRQRHVYDKCTWNAVIDDYMGNICVESAQYADVGMKNTYIVSLCFGQEKNVFWGLFEGIGPGGHGIAARAAACAERCLHEAIGRKTQQKMMSGSGIEKSHEKKTGKKKHNVDRPRRAEILADSSDRHDEDILEEMLQLIHQECLSSQTLASCIHSSGCAAVVGILRPGKSRLTVANCGHCSAVLCQVNGNFNAIRPTWDWLSTCHTMQSITERTKMKDSLHPDHESDSHRKGDVYLKSHQPSLHLDSTGEIKKRVDEVYVTRAIGTIAKGNKRKNSTGALEVSTKHIDLKFSSNGLQHPLHLIVGSSGFFNTVGPIALSFRSHLYHKLRLNRQLHTQAAALSGGTLPTPAQGQGNLAEHLVNFSLNQIVEQLKKISSSHFGEFYSIEDLMSVPFGKDNENISDKPFAHHTNDQKDDCKQSISEDDVVNNEDTFLASKSVLENLTRRDIHKDLACLVLTITPPNATTPSSRIKVESKLTNNYMRDLALYRWDQFKFLLTFQRLMRKEISSRWDDLIAKTLRNARKYARLEAERKRLQESLDFKPTKSQVVPIQTSCPQVL